MLQPGPWSSGADRGHTPRPGFWSVGRMVGTCRGRDPGQWVWGSKRPQRLWGGGCRACRSCWGLGRAASVGWPWSLGGLRAVLLVETGSCHASLLGWAPVKWRAVPKACKRAYSRGAPHFSRLGLGAVEHCPHSLVVPDGLGPLWPPLCLSQSLGAGLVLPQWLREGLRAARGGAKGLSCLRGTSSGRWQAGEPRPAPPAPLHLG